MCLCGGEVEVHDGHHSGLHKTLGQNVLAGASLVGGQHVVHAEDLLHGSLQTVESLASGIRVVGGVHGSGLAVRHGINARVGEHIQIDVFVLEQEGVVARLLNGTQALFNGQQVQFLDDAHLVHLQRYLVFWFVKFN